MASAPQPTITHKVVMADIKHPHVLMAGGTRTLPATARSVEDGRFEGASPRQVKARAICQKESEKATPPARLGRLPAVPQCKPGQQPRGDKDGRENDLVDGLPAEFRQHLSRCERTHSHAAEDQEVVK